jgi:putative hydrolase of the HAD superfamily
MIKTIIFDLGGVVVAPFGNELLKNASQKLNIEADELRQLMNQYEIELQTGKIDHIEFWQKILRDKNLSVSEEVLQELWLEPYIENAKIDIEVLDLIKLLHQNYFIGCISNSQEPHNTYNRNRGLFEYFDLVLLSNEIGIRKPDKEIFELFLAKTNFKPEQTVFIDDEEKLLENARMMGINTIHFENAKRLELTLRNMGVIS